MQNIAVLSNFENSVVRFCGSKCCARTTKKNQRGDNKSTQLSNLSKRVWYIGDHFCCVEWRSTLSTHPLKTYQTHTERRGQWPVCLHCSGRLTTSVQRQWTKTRTVQIRLQLYSRVLTRILGFSSSDWVVANRTIVRTVEIASASVRRCALVPNLPTLAQGLYEDLRMV